MTDEDTADHRPDVYREDDRWVFRASTLGNCDTQLILTALGYEPEPAPDWMMKAWKEGQKAEPKIIKRLSDIYGWKPVPMEELLTYGDIDDSGQLVLELKIGDKAVVRCHPDGIFMKTPRAADMEDDSPFGDTCLIGERRVGEVKCLGDSWLAQIERDGLKAAPFYDWQYSVECAVTQLDGIYIIGQKDPEKEDEEGHRVLSAEPLIRKFYTPSHSMGDIKARVLRLIRMIEKIQDGKADVPLCSYRMYPCNQFQMHDDDDPMHKAKEAAIEVQGIDKDVAADLSWAGRQLIDRKTREKKNKDEATDIQARIDKLVANAGIVVPDEGILVNGVRIVRRSRRGGIGWKAVAIKLAGNAGVENEQGVDRTRGNKSEWWEATIEEKGK